MLYRQEPPWAASVKGSRRRPLQTRRSVSRSDSVEALRSREDDGGGSTDGQRAAGHGANQRDTRTHAHTHLHAIQSSRQKDGRWGWMPQLFDVGRGVAFFSCWHRLGELAEALQRAGTATRRRLNRKQQGLQAQMLLAGERKIQSDGRIVPIPHNILPLPSIII